MQTNSYSPYALKDMYQSIDLIDRKIAHGTAWETFDSQDARDAYLRKLSTKRAGLVKSALMLANLGAQCDPQFLPRSFTVSLQDETSSPATNPAVAKKANRKSPARPRLKKASICL